MSHSLFLIANIQFCLNCNNIGQTSRERFEFFIWGLFHVIWESLIWHNIKICLYKCLNCRWCIEMTSNHSSFSEKRIKVMKSLLAVHIYWKALPYHIPIMKAKWVNMKPECRTFSIIQEIYIEKVNYSAVTGEPWLLQTLWMILNSSSHLLYRAWKCFEGGEIWVELSSL